MKTLSVRQPWASLLVSGLKDIENRTWAPNYKGNGQYPYMGLIPIKERGSNGKENNTIKGR